MHSWFPVEWSKKVKSKPIGVVLKGIPIVLFRSQGRVRALLDKCPHRNAPLSKGFIKNEKLICPYHGWCFKGDGSSDSIPGLRSSTPKKAHRVQTYEVRENYGLIWLSLTSNPKSDIPKLSFHKYPKSFELTAMVNSSLKDVIENALDPLHTHFVHGGLIRTDTKRERILIKMRITKDLIEAEYCNEPKQQGLIHKILSLGRSVEKSFGRFIHPSLFQMEFQTTRQEIFLINGFLSPISECCSKIFLISLTNAPIPQFLLKILVKPLFIIALKQDKKILELRERHIHEFGIGRQISTEGDLFGPYLDLLMKNKELPEKEYEVELYV